MMKTIVSLATSGLLFATLAMAAGQHSVLPQDSHFPQLLVSFRHEKGTQGAWMGMRPSDHAQFRLDVYRMPTRAEALRVADNGTMGQSSDTPGKFVSRSLATSRKIGDEYWLSDKDLNKMKGSVVTVIRHGNDVYVGYISKIGRTSTGWADPKPITRTDLALLEDLILDAIHQIDVTAP